MIYLVECFAIVQVYDVDFVAIVEALQDRINMLNQLSETTPIFSEAMLIVWK